MPLRRTPRTLDERGSAPVEFVLVGTLVALLVAGVLQLAFTVFTRNIVQHAAVAGAAHAALADVPVEEGDDYALDRIRETLGSAFDADAEVAVVDGEIGAEVVVTVQAPLPLLGLLGVPRSLETSGKAPLEALP